MSSSRSPTRLVPETAGEEPDQRGATDAIEFIEFTIEVELDCLLEVVTFESDDIIVRIESARNRIADELIAYDRNRDVDVANG